MATILMIAAVAALAVTSSFRSHERASVASAAVSAPHDSGEALPFAFGYLVFEHDPAKGVPGFAASPSSASAR